MSTNDRLLGAGHASVRPAEREQNLVRRAGRLAGWAARTGYSVTRRLPGVDAAERGFRQVERQVFGELRRRLDQVDDPYLSALSAASAMKGTGAAGPDRGRAGAFEVSDSVAVVPARDAEPLRAAMAELLNRSVGLSRSRAREYLHAMILRQLTPDEARILAVLAEGAPFPTVDLAERGGLGGSGRTVLRNASTIGKIAGVSLTDHVPEYLTRLVGLALAEIGDELPALETQYEVLLTDETVRLAEETAKRVRVVRRSVRISPLGAQFWLACDPAARH